MIRKGLRTFFGHPDPKQLLLLEIDETRRMLEDDRRMIAAQVFDAIDALLQTSEIAIRRGGNREQIFEVIRRHNSDLRASLDKALNTDGPVTP
jgi:hypothetical protein